MCRVPCRKRASDFEKTWSEATAGITDYDAMGGIGSELHPVYRHPKKNWRIKQKAMPQWFKARAACAPAPNPVRPEWRASEVAMRIVPKLLKFLPLELKTQAF